MLRRLHALTLWAAIFASVATAHAGDQLGDWPLTEGAPGGGRYSPLADINRDNVAQLQVAWTYRHGDYFRATWRPDYINRSTAFEATPIVVDERLIFSTPFNRVIALDPETGRELWTFDPKIDRDEFYANMMISRGVAYWRGGSEDQACSRRVFLATLDARLIALDAATGVPCTGFGNNGEINLLADLAGVVDAREYNVTSPPVVVGNVVVVGSALADLVRRIQPPGDVRAFDAQSGKLLWTFHTIPHPGEIGNDTWENGSWIQAGGATDIPAVLQLTKTGMLFAFDRTNGQPLFPIEERPVPPSDVPGEHAWPTQPFPLKPPPLSSHRIREEDLWDVDSDRLEACRKWLRELRNEGIFTPPSLRGSHPRACTPARSPTSCDRTGSSISSSPPAATSTSARRWVTT